MIRITPSLPIGICEMSICLPSPLLQWTRARKNGCQLLHTSRQRCTTAQRPRNGCNLFVAFTASNVLTEVGNDRPKRREDFLQVSNVSYRPPGTEFDLLDKVSMSLPEKRYFFDNCFPFSWSKVKVMVNCFCRSPCGRTSTVILRTSSRSAKGFSTKDSIVPLSFRSMRSAWNNSAASRRIRLGLLYGPSGSGKTTLLQVLGGLTTPTEGSIYLGDDGHESVRKPAGPASLSSRVGIVFQFPERYFLTDTIVEELLFGYSRQTQDFQLRQALTMRLQTAITAVGLSGMPLDMNPRSLSGGYKRRLALAVQLVRMPEIILLDEPLAGLDWRARRDVIKLLAAIKKEKTVIVVSHDLRELAELVDKSWHMDMGGKLREQSLSPDLQVSTM